MSTTTKAAGEKATTALETDAFKVAQEIIAANRDATVEEGAIIAQALRDGTEVQKAALQAIMALAERQQTGRAMTAASHMLAASHRRQSEWLLQRPARWAATNETARLIYALAENLPFPMQAAFIEIAKSFKDGFLSVPIPTCFESDRLPR
jgi:hypothetical protein